ncbi:tetratricopeptide repeat protein [Streptomyces sp. VRA16 Mangrove soil]|uniref:tetratricopeptide repeat protein n=1 Tax=Streptomyces sp. VRA16 Mangrove soil TaxID=2817434 RepID=UPI001A9EE677|nr:tetratricopeptide repeat protein [Streptomyces sp. VRA16 Mangrove soil]MBO1337746.1 tetratricopeptide repeat protein [Streptomyces sp. VRA16 Mangrove soil]
MEHSENSAEPAAPVDPTEPAEATGPSGAVAERAPVADPRRRLSPGVRRTVQASLAGCLVLGGVLVMLPDDEPAPAPLPGPAGRAVIAAAVGAPASLPDLTALIGERETYLRTHPRDGLSWAALGAAYVERGSRTAETAYYPKAERALRSSLKVRPKGNAEALDGLAALAAARGDWRSARIWGEAAVKAAPKRWSSYVALVDAYRGTGDYKAAGRTLETLTGLTSGAGTTVTLRTAAVYRDRGWREDAATVVADASARAGTATEKAALLQRGGELAWERGEPVDALRHFDAALAADPGCHPALAGRARALASLGRTAEAVVAYQRALRKQPLPQYALELGELYESLHDERSAEAQYGVLRKRVADDRAHGVDDALVLGRFEADHGDADAAVDRLRAEWSRAPGIATADALGWALHRAGDDDAAHWFLRRATDRQKGGTVRNASYSYHLGAVERELGLYGAARRHLGEALRINPGFSPLYAPAAQEALDALGEPAEGGVPQMWPPKPKAPPVKRVAHKRR